MRPNCEAKIAAEHNNLPLYLLGFSLGALVFEYLESVHKAGYFMDRLYLMNCILFSGSSLALPAANHVIDRLDLSGFDTAHNKAFSHDEAVKIIQDGRGTQFDPALTDAFIKVMEQ